MTSEMDQAAEDFWIHMSIFEIRAQAQFAEMAFKNIGEKPGRGDEWAVFSSIHSFLSHCAMVSKMLTAKGTRRSVYEALGLPVDSIVHDRQFRNHLEHYDERLKQWIKKAGVGSRIINHIVGHRADLPTRNTVIISFYDPYERIFTFVDEEFDLGKLFKCVEAIKKTANTWLGYTA